MPKDKKISPEVNQEEFDAATMAASGEEMPQEEVAEENPVENIQDYGYPMPSTSPNALEKAGIFGASLAAGLGAGSAVRGPNTGPEQAAEAFKAAFGMASGLVKQRAEAINTALERLPLKDVSPALASKFPALAGLPSKMAYETIRDIQVATAKSKVGAEAKQSLKTGIITEKTAPQYVEMLKTAGVKGIEPEMLVGLSGDRVLSMAKSKEQRDENKIFTNTSALRKEHAARSKDFITIRNNFGTIKNAENNPTGVSDMSLIFAYMKVLDPTSVVRESEYATAQNSGSVPETVRGQYNKALSGQKISDAVRNDFIKQAKKEYNTKANIQLQLDERYRKIAEKNRLSADEAVISPVLSWEEFNATPIEPGAPKSAPKVPGAPKNENKFSLENFKAFQRARNR